MSASLNLWSSHDGGYQFHLCSFPFLPIRITDPGLNINLKISCVNANATCGEIVFTGEVIFYP